MTTAYAKGQPRDYPNTETKIADQSFSSTRAVTKHNMAELVTAQNSKVRAQIHNTLKKKLHGHLEHTKPQLKNQIWLIFSSRFSSHNTPLIYFPIYSFPCLVFIYLHDLLWWQGLVQLYEKRSFFVRIVG